MTIACPLCGSKKTVKDGKRRLSDGSEAQRYLCRNCGYRFTDPRTRQIFKVRNGITRYAGVNPALKLVEVKEETEGTPKTRETTTDLKSLLFNYAWHLKKNGYAPSTIETRVKLLRQLAQRGADLYDPESVKDVIARQDGWSNARKELAVQAYTSFLKMHGGTWDPPSYKRVEKLPWIPTEEEIDQLIAGCSRRVATFLQLLKETGMRPGEAWMLKWDDIDFQNNTVRVTPEKGSKPRILKISNRLVSMLKSLPMKNDYVFKNGKLHHFRGAFRQQRKRIAFKLKNPRINRITFKTLRHFKATMEYHKTKDILHVKELLGHKNIKNTLVYTHLVNFKDDEFISKIARNAEEACKLVEAGFEYVCTTPENLMIFRKRK